MKKFLGLGLALALAVTTFAIPTYAQGEEYKPINGGYEEFGNKSLRATSSSNVDGGWQVPNTISNADQSLGIGTSIVRSYYDYR